MAEADAPLAAPSPAPHTVASPADPAFRADVLAGLACPQKAVPARWFYDLRGSQLFEEITALPEYRATRAEARLLSNHGPAIASAAGPGRSLIEFGSGSSAKTRLLIASVEPATYVPIDISGEFLQQAALALAGIAPGLRILPVEGDFTQPVRLPAAALAHPLLGFFPGSTIGNLAPAAAVDLLRSIRGTLADAGGVPGLLLIGMDGMADIDALRRAYDDAQGVTARFNLNLLHRINRELGGTIPMDAFAHAVRWNPAWNRIEMHLEAQRSVAFTVSGQPFSMAPGETIHTENSHKYTPEAAALLLQAGGWEPHGHWQDAATGYLLVLARPTDLSGPP